MKKKVLSTLLAITMVAGMMTGCGKEESPAATADTASTTEKEVTYKDIMSISHTIPAKEVWDLVLTDELVENHQVFEIDNTEENKEK